jgi:hypothetical protein
MIELNSSNRSRSRHRFHLNFSVFFFYLVRKRHLVDVASWLYTTVARNIYISITNAVCSVVEYWSWTIGFASEHKLYCVRESAQDGVLPTPTKGKTYWIPSHILTWNEGTEEDEVAGDLQLRHFQSMVQGNLLLFPSSLFSFLRMFLYASL